MLKLRKDGAERTRARAIGARGPRPRPPPKSWGKRWGGGRVVRHPGSGPGGPLAAAVWAAGAGGGAEPGGGTGAVPSAAAPLLKAPPAKPPPPELRPSAAASDAGSEYVLFRPAVRPPAGIESRQPTKAFPSPPGGGSGQGAAAAPPGGVLTEVLESVPADAAGAAVAAGADAGPAATLPDAQAAGPGQVAAPALPVAKWGSGWEGYHPGPGGQPAGAGAPTAVLLGGASPAECSWLGAFTGGREHRASRSRRHTAV